MALVVLGAGCPSEESIFGPATESVCPPAGTSLTYTNFGKPFMESYCTRCHSSELVGSQRQGAPSFHDFDSQFGVKAVSKHVDQTTAAGPAATNDGMPPDKPAPTLEEREQLGEWIACGMP
ncbi:MAG: hypothetical protein H0T46_02625 [Deltaproteobacteria bacterium]|nr:hypothetical protein [Deltaproteobacteria bacterium]